MSEGSHLPQGLVTFLFTDIEGSTRLARMLGGRYRTVLTEHRAVLRSAWGAGGGTALSTEGDSLFVAFADASAALVACARAQRALAEHDWPEPAARPMVRMGLHTGYAQPHGREYTSLEVHRAARVAAAAHGDQVICSAATARAAGALAGDAWLLDLGLHRLRGFDAAERLFQLVAPGLTRRFPRLRTAARAAHNLPAPVSTFVGRGDEQRELTELLDRYRLVTVLGPGGAGKTRLAVHTAESLTDAYPDGVWFVDLASVTDPGLVAVSVAATLGLRPEPGRAVADTLAEYAATRRFLLILDTCDAQPAAAALAVGRLLGGGPGARVLATSREPLGLPGEVVWRIPPLSLAGGRDGTPSEAVRLLLDRSASATGVPAERASTADRLDLQRIAERLEGLPLAMELAAARLRVLSTRQLAVRLEDVLGTLDAGQPAARCDTISGGSDGPADRHATMQATVTWSYRTLGHRAARMLRWLSVFSGRVDLPAVGALTGTDPFDELAVLVDKSLVQAEPAAAGMTYRLLDPIRGYAGRLLAETGEEQEARDRHVAWAADAVAGLHRGEDGQPVTMSMYAVDPLADELRAALRWATGRGSARQGLRIVGGMDQWWRERGLAREGRLWLFRLYDRLSATGEPVPDGDLAAAYQIHAQHARVDGEYAEELRYSERAEEAARRAGDPGLVARVLAGRGPALCDLGDEPQAERTAREVIAWAAEQGVAGDALAAVYFLAELLWTHDRLDEAADLLATARAVEAGRPAERGQRVVDMMLGMVALRRGDLVAAHEHLSVALRSQIGYGYRTRACDTVTGFAVRCGLAGGYEVAARLFGAADAGRAALRHPAGVFTGYWASTQSAVRAALGDSIFDAAYAVGSRLGLAEAAGLALAVEHPDLAPDSARFATADSWA